MGVGEGRIAEPTANLTPGVALVWQTCRDRPAVLMAPTRHQSAHNLQWAIHSRGLRMETTEMHGMSEARTIRGMALVQTNRTKRPHMQAGRYVLLNSGVLASRNRTIG